MQILDVNITFRINWCTIYNFEHDMKLDAQYEVECTYSTYNMIIFIIEHFLLQGKSIDPLSIWKIQVPATTQQAKCSYIFIVLIFIL